MRRKYVCGIAAVVLCLAVLLALGLYAVSARLVGSASATSNSDIRVYQVDRKVCDFPPGDDFSTPETAYAAANRAQADGDQDVWRRISVKELADILPPAAGLRRYVSPEDQQKCLNTRIVEVRIFRETHAVVIAKAPSAGIWPHYEIRNFVFEDGKWRNRGQSGASTLGRARAAFAQRCEYVEQQTPPHLPPADPRAHLQTFVQFLTDKGEEPQSFVMRALAHYKVVIIGEVHHRPRYWAFNSSLVTDPNFPKRVGAIYLELPSNDQHLVDQFLASSKCDTAPVLEMLRDNLWTGWPDQAMLDFFTTVWMVNRDLTPQQRLRIVLVDMQRPWSKIENRQDWSQYEVDRDQLMAKNIVRDVQQDPNEQRNGLFIVGVGHAPLNAKFLVGWPILTAGWYLRQQLGAENVYAIFQHRPVMTNAGRVDGRLCLGLFESAFAALGNKPVAFPLDTGPFGKEPYDADPDRPVGSTYADGFSAYLYLGPLETETFSPLIAGFYTPAFVKELDRRHRIMFDKSWAESYGREEMTAETFIDWMGDSWGKPRKDWRPEVLGPLDAWRQGGRRWKEPDKAKKLIASRPDPQEVLAAARELFGRIQNADYDRFVDEAGSRRMKFSAFPTADLYTVQGDYGGFVQWVCTHFRDNPIVSVELGEVFTDTGPVAQQWYCPAVPYTIVLKDGTTLKGNLPFVYNERAKRWRGVGGLDWHLLAKEAEQTDCASGR